MQGQINSSVQSKLDAFIFQQYSLVILIIRRRTLTDFATRIDHSVPRNIMFGRQSSQRITDLTGMSRPVN